MKDQKRTISLAETKANQIAQAKAQARQAVEHMRAYMPEQLELFDVQAQALRAKFVKLKEAGFTDKEALEIVKTRPIFE